MKKRSKKYLKAFVQIQQTKQYLIAEGIQLLKKISYANFDESVELTFRLGIDPRHADQNLRGALVLPAGTGKQVRVCVITSGDKIKIAEDAGADFVGGDDIIAKISKGWLDFDRVIASLDMMGKLGKIGRILGPRGLMPNPKLGTVTMDIAKAIEEQKSGKIEYKTEKKGGNIHVIVGKKSFEDEDLNKNIMTILERIIKIKPAASKGTYLRSLTLSTTMGPSIKLDTLEVMKKKEI